MPLHRSRRTDGRVRCALSSAALVLLLVSMAGAQAPVSYVLSFPEPHHRWMQVEVTFPDLGDATLEARMSRTSPGRYALHEFAKNVLDVQAFDGRGRRLDATRPNPHQWNVAGHDGTVRLVYRIYGDRVDGTYLGIDATHAHINMPAALMWARTLEDRPARLRFVRPPGASWRVATQLYPTDDPLVFTAPNLPYLKDSPVEFGDFALRTFDVPDPKTGTAVRFRIALHHLGTDAEADAFAADVEKITREQGFIFGEYPAFETGAYTYLADYLPWASSDGMEHRNSTVLTSPASLAAPQERAALLGTVSHELFHAWNVERIRPQSLEPFDFEEANMSAKLWLAEGFTSYYGPLAMHRAGLLPLDDLTRGFAGGINAVLLGPGREFRSVVDMSRLAPFLDAAAAIDRTNWGNAFISYYTWGAAIGLGLDLTLREVSGGRLTLDDYMRLLWERFGRPAPQAPGLVARPYTMADARTALADLVDDRPFADEFFDRYIEGRNVVDYARLLRQAGLVLRPRGAGRAWAGELHLDGQTDGLRIAAPVPFGSPAYHAGLAQDDRIVSVAGEPVGSTAALQDILDRHRPGDRVPIEFVRRDGVQPRATLALRADPHLELVTVESTGRTLTGAQGEFRQRWLGSRAEDRVPRGGNARTLVRCGCSASSQL
jgi:predicted metalloprotease with PDZ domain